LLRESWLSETFSKGVPAMLGLALTFLLIALLAGLFGFGLVAGMSFKIAQVLFFVFLVLFIISLISGSIRRPV
jgi:uncharacterized membrane protein YtjA (UPF0391 family)